MTIKVTGELKLNHSPVFVLLQIHGSDWSIHQLQFEKLLEGELGKGEAPCKLPNRKKKWVQLTDPWNKQIFYITNGTKTKLKSSSKIDQPPVLSNSYQTCAANQFVCFPKSQLMGYVNHWYITTDHSIVFEEQMSDWVTILFAQNEKKFL